MSRPVFRALTSLGLTAALASEAPAAYVLTVQPVGADIVATGSGSINTAALRSVSVTLSAAAMAPIVGRLEIGPTVSTARRYYNGATIVSSFGNGSYSAASSGAGPAVGVVTYNAEIAVPAGYVSGTPLGVSTATWADRTYADLGLKPGTYVSTWGVGATADSFTVNVLVPEPSVAIMGLVGLLAARRLGRCVS